MKKIIILSAVVAVITLTCLTRNALAQSSGFQTTEYVTIRWAGRENTHLIRSNGKVEFLGQILGKVTRPDRVDERAFFMNLAMNAVAKEGYEFAGMNNDEVVMKRTISK